MAKRTKDSKPHVDAEPMRDQTRADLNEALDEQLGFLRTSAREFDAGNAAEGKRLAGAIRTLVHDGRPPVTSLLTQLDLRSTLRFYDRQARNPIPPNAIMALSVGLGFTGPGLRHQANLEPITDTSNFETWWHGVLIVTNRRPFRRKELVMLVANSDGGAHVDRRITEAYAQLSRDFNSMWAVHKADGTMGIVENGPHLVAIRQIAFELEQTIDAYLRSSGATQSV
jgi:hypothetical protein